MKELKAVILLFAFSSTVAWSQTSQSSAPGVHRTWTVLITPQTKKQYLDSISIAWKKDSIELKFSKLEYTSKGMLVKLKGSVSIMNSDKLPNGTFSSDNLESYRITVGKPWRVELEGK